MTMNEIYLLLGLIAEGVALVGTIVAFGRKIYKRIKELKIEKFVEEAMADVEVLAISGDLKKLKVLERVTAVFGEGKDIYEKASSYIEDCIEFSKKINHK